MTTLRDALREAADSAPSSHGLEDPAWVAESWKRGRRRRVASRAAAGAMAAVVVALVVGIVGAFPGGPSRAVPADPPSVSSATLAGYPQRIGHQWQIGDLPERPGPMAGLIRVGSGEGTTGQWHAVDQQGRRYRLVGPTGDYQAAISADGHRLAWNVGMTIRIVDVVTGAQWDRPLTSSEQLRWIDKWFFSPSGKHLLLPLDGLDGTRSGGLVLTPQSGDVAELTFTGYEAVGWADDDHLVGRHLRAQTDGTGAEVVGAELDLVSWPWEKAPSADGTVTAYGGFLRSNWPEGETEPRSEISDVALDPGRQVVAFNRGRDEPVLDIWSPSGALVASARLRFPADGCPVSFGSAAPAIFVPPGTAVGDQGLVAFGATDTNRLVAIDSSVGARCLVLARDALVAGPLANRLGTADQFFLWWWKELLLAVGAGVVVVALRPWLRRGGAFATGFARHWERLRRLLSSRVVEVVVLALTLVAVLSGVGFRLPFGHGETITSHPSRIGHQWLVRDLPDRPGPMAALIHVSDDAGVRWHVVSESGVQFRIPGFLGSPPALSDDGRLLGYREAGRGDFVVWDLVEGGQRRYEDVGGASGDETTDPWSQEYPFVVRTPRFSRDGARVAVDAARPAGQWGRVLVLLEDGARTEALGMDSMAGWLDEFRLLGRGPRPADDDVDRRVPLVVWDARSGLTEPLAELNRPADPGLAGLLNESWGWVLPDGSVGVAWSTETDGLVFTRHALPTGTETGRWANGALPSERVVRTAAGWRGNQPVVSTEAGMLDLGAVPSGQRIVAVENARSLFPVTMAADALDGPASWSLFGTSNLTLTWWWRELLVLLGLVVVVRRVIAARRRPVGDP